MSDYSPDRCGYTWPENHEESDDTNHQSCCWRETMEGSNHCVWHADPEEVSKSTEALQESRTSPPIREKNSPVAELLDGANLAGFELGNEINLQRVSLRESDFTDAGLEDADLTEAHLQNANFMDANLKDADFTDARLEDGNFTDSHLWGAELTGAHLWDAKLTDAYLRGADLTDAYLQDADFTEAHLWGADLTGAHLTDAILRDAHLQDANLTEAYLRDAHLTEAYLRDANLTDAVLRDAHLTGAVFPDADLTDAVLRNADFTDAHLWDADLTGADLRDADLTDVDLQNSDLTDVDLQNANFTDTDLHEATLHRVDAENTDFTSADLTEASLSGSDCESADFENAVLVRASLENVDLVDATLAGAHLFGTRLEGSRIDSATQLVAGGSIGDVTVAERCRYDPDAPPEGPEASLAIDQIEINAASDPLQVIQLRRARNAYRRLEELARQNGFPSLQSRMFKRRQEMRRYLLREQGERTRWLFAELQRWLFVYGEGFRRIVGISAVAIVLSWLAYTTTGIVENKSGESITLQKIADDPVLIYDTLLHSLLVFFAGVRKLETTGRIGESVVVLESVVGPILVALLIFVLGRRAAR